jgi:hypothetical protein
MKSRRDLPSLFQKKLQDSIIDKDYTGMLIAQYELYRKVSQLEGCIVKCGVVAGNGLTRFAMLAKLMAVKTIQNLVAFEKNPVPVGVKTTREDNRILLDANNASITGGDTNVGCQGITDTIQFIPGEVNDAIPNYLIENPEMKIAYLNIDFDEYEATFTTLQYFYPRLVHGGILVLDNYYKKEEDYDAVNDYFQHEKHKIYNFSVNKGPDYLVRM